MRQKSGPEKQPAEDAIRDVRRATRRHFSAEERIPIVLVGLRGEESIAELCRREGIASSMYYGWSKEFLARHSRPHGPARGLSRRPNFKLRHYRLVHRVTRGLHAPVRIVCRGPSISGADLLS
jgi:transposase-like protein